MYLKELTELQRRRKFPPGAMSGCQRSQHFGHVASLVVSGCQDFPQRTATVDAHKHEDR
jgi:hypothetical protein